jgi:hypothetical protein
MDGFDTNWWGVYAFPVGTAICFGPVLVAWILACRKDAAPAPQKKKR